MTAKTFRCLSPRVGAIEFYFVASDIPAVLYHTRDIFYLGDGEIAVLTREGVTVTDFENNPVSPDVQRITWDPIAAEKGGRRRRTQPGQPQVPVQFRDRYFFEMGCGGGDFPAI